MSDQVFPSNIVFIVVIVSRALSTYCCNLPFLNMGVNLNFELSGEICLWLCGKSFSSSLTAHCLCSEILYDLMGRDKIKLVISWLILCLYALAVSFLQGLLTTHFKCFIYPFLYQLSFAKRETNGSYQQKISPLS